MNDFTSEILEYMIRWDVSSFFHLSVSSMYDCAAWYFVALIGIKLGWGILRDALNI